MLVCVYTSACARVTSSQCCIRFVRGMAECCSEDGKTVSYAGTSLDLVYAGRYVTAGDIDVTRLGMPRKRRHASHSVLPVPRLVFLSLAGPPFRSVPVPCQSAPLRADLVTRLRLACPSRAWRGHVP